MATDKAVTERSKSSKYLCRLHHHLLSNCCALIWLLFDQAGCIAIYRGLVVVKCDNILGETQGVDENKHANLIQSTFWVEDYHEFSSFGPGSATSLIYTGTFRTMNLFYKHSFNVCALMSF